MNMVNLSLKKMEGYDALGNVSVDSLAAALGCSEEYVMRVAKTLNYPVDKEQQFSGSLLVQFIQVAFDNLPSWLVSVKGKRVKRSRLRLKYYRSLCLYLIEESDFLMALPEQERMDCREAFATVLSVVDTYLMAEKLMEPGYFCNPESFVEKVMTKMQKTGFIYKVEDVFRQMIALFRILPELMNSKMAQLMDIMLLGEVNKWQDEELRLQLMRLLSHYIDTNKAAVDAIVDFESKTDQDKLMTMIKAIAMQLYLYDPTDGINYALRRSALYRYASHTRIAEGDTRVLLDKAYYCLVCAIDSTTRKEYTWEQIRSIDMLVSMLKSKSEYKDIEKLEFCAKAADITFTKGEIDICEHTSGNKQAKVVAAGIVPWHGMKIRLNSDPSLRVGSTTTDVDKLKRWWSETEKTLTTSSGKKTNKSAKRRAYIDEDVDIIIDGIEDVDRGIFRCHIKSDKIEGAGTIAVHEIVNYKVRPEAMMDISHLAFNNPETGKPSLFEATVLKDNGGVLEFSMKKRLNKYLMDSDYLGFGYETTCVIASLNIPGQIAIGVSSDGHSVILPYEESVLVGDYYNIRVVQVKNNKQGIQLTCEKLSPTTEEVTQDKAFIRLMQEYGIVDESPEEVVIVPQVKKMSEESVSELIRLLDRESLQQSEVHCRYNYLFMAKVLAHIAGNDDLVTYYDNRLKLQKLLYDFSKNNTIDREKLLKLEELDQTMKQSYPVLSVRIKEIHVLECLKNPDRNADLFEALQSETNTELKRLINLVLAYNHLSSFGQHEQLDTIISQINELLKVKIEVPEAHYFGEETDQCEFKSSVVYVANAEGKHIADIEQQTNVILKEVCAFLNTKGGTLYIGVNDYGYAQGLDVDLQWFQQHVIWHVKDIDDYRQYVVNALCRKWPNLKDMFDVTFPQIKGHQAVAVKVMPCKNPVDLNGDYYCRVGSECRKITEEGLAGFMERRPMQYDLYMESKN